MAVFAAPANARAVVALILIENSHQLFPFWHQLSHTVLPTLLGSLRLANPSLPIPVLWLTTAPVGDDPASIHAPPPRQYNQLPELKFSFAPDNKISSRIISRATELMLEAATQFHGDPVGFHLFIVAASSPIQGTWGVSVTMPTHIGQSEWRLLGQRIAQLGIHCHMILPASHDMPSMNELFNTALQLQGHTQVPPWFPASDYTFLLSSEPSSPAAPHPDSHFAAQDPPAVDTLEGSPLQEHPQPFDVHRPPVLRHQSFPQDVQSSPPTQSTNTPTPSLVSSLQRVHGLSRKKLYGTQPQRQPFVREEPVRAKYKSAPTPLSIPVGSQPLYISEHPRVPGKTKVERGRRSDRHSHAADASSSRSPGRKSPWNHVASSDVGSSPSSPTNSLSPHHTTSPTMPLYPDLAAYPPNMSSTSAPFAPGILTTVPISESNLTYSPIGDPSVAYFAMSPQFRSPTTTAIPVSSQGPVWSPISKPVAMSKSATARRYSQEFPHGSNVQSLSAMSSKYRLDALSTEPRPKSTQQKVKDAGDVPFIFSPELEAATAAKLKAALQSTPPVPSSAFTAFTLGNQPNYAANTVTEDAYVSSQQPSAPPLALPLGLGYDQMQDADGAGNINIHCGDGEPHSGFVGSTSSSLQGWAG